MTGPLLLANHGTYPLNMEPPCLSDLMAIPPAVPRPLLFTTTEVTHFRVLSFFAQWTYPGNFKLRFTM
jgi:hypothetical protein